MPFGLDQFSCAGFSTFFSFEGVCASPTTVALLLEIKALYLLWLSDQFIPLI
jgi:hypothetical protein